MALALDEIDFAAVDTVLARYRRANAAARLGVLQRRRGDRRGRAQNRLLEAGDHVAQPASVAPLGLSDIADGGCDCTLDAAAAA